MDTVNNISDIVDEHWQRGSDLYEAGRVHDAILAWREGLDAEPDRADLYYNIGVALCESGHKDEAVHHWRKAIRLRPGFYEPHYHLICALAAQIKLDSLSTPWQELRSLCRDALSLNPVAVAQKTYLLQLLGRAEWEIGDKHAAMDFIKAAMKAEPEGLWNHEMLRDMQLQMGDWRAAWRTAAAITALPDFDTSSYQPCIRRIQALTTGVFLVAACVCLVAFIKTKRS